MENKRRVDLSIENPVLNGARMGMDTCLKMAVARAISTGSMKGSATLKVTFELEDVIDKDTGETYISPKIGYKNSYSVPKKDSVEGTVIELCRIVPKDGKYLLVNNQISMDELMEEETEE